MKNTLRIFAVSPVVLLGMLASLSMPVRAEGSMPTDAAEAPSLPDAPSLPEAPNVPSVDELAPETEGESTDMSDEASDDTSADMPTEEAPTAEVAPTPEGTPSETTPTEDPTAESPTPEPTAESGPDETPATDSASSAPTIVDVASSSESFSTLVTAIEAAGLKESLMADGTFTVFAPTNAAFEALPPGVLEQLLMPENKATLAKVLTHHVLSDKRMAADLSTEEVTSMADSALQIKVDEAGVGIDNAKVLQADVDASNGVIHVIDQVLIPQELIQPAPAEPGS